MASKIDKLLDAGIAHQAAGRFTDAEPMLRQVLQWQPNNADALHYLGLVLHQTGRSDEGLPLLGRSAALAPGVAGFRYNYGKCLAERIRPDAAVAQLTEALRLEPRLVDGYLQLGAVLRTQGRLDEAIAAFAQGARLAPMLPCASGLLYTLWFHPRRSPESIFQEHRAWASRFVDPIASGAAPHANDRDPHRRLRIGYVSPDFRNHVIGRYIEPVLARHDRERFEVCCYSDVATPDPLTRQIRAHAIVWRETFGMSHERVAETIRGDAIDILVDLTSHAGLNRLLAFARRPAPVQVTYLAYPTTTGLAAMDYRVTDARLDPPGMTEHLHTEKLLRLPGSYWVYPPRADAPAVNDLPAARNGCVTFGSLNAFTKINADVLAVWSRILAALPDSRLHVLLPGGVENNRHAPPMFQSSGIDPARVRFIEFQSHANYPRLFHEIDVTLDPFPYPGHTTSLDSLFMGVPVVTLAGQSPVSRAGVSVLAHAGLDDLVAGTRDAYVRIATDLARDLPRLAALRRELRPRMLGGPLADHESLTRSLESAYRTIWQRRCRGESPSDLTIDR
jgi:hypothetical protein